MTDTEMALPPKCEWVEAKDLRAGDQIAILRDDGSHTFERVTGVKRANWIRSADGPCVEICFNRDRFGQISGPKDEWARRVGA